MRQGAATDADGGRGRGPVAQLIVYGATPCEDTAITRSRLRTLGVPFDEVDLDITPEAAAWVEALNGGQRVTPTLVFGDGETVAAEPDLERLDELLAAAGYPVEPRPVVQLHGDIIGRPIPFRRLGVVGGGSFSLEHTRGRTQVALFFAHAAACLACFGYARQLGAAREALADVDAVPIIAVPGPPEIAVLWRHEIDDGVTIVADAKAAWKRHVFGYLGAPEDGVGLLMLDRFAAPRATSFAAEAGGVANPGQAAEWLGFFALDCPECSGELPWPDPEAVGEG